MKRAKLNKSIKKDALSVVGGLCSLNAPNAIGYLFNPSEDNKSVSTGMFCSFKSEINSNDWTYFLDCSDGEFYEIP